MAKVLQRLARAGLLRAVRGVGGGYRLARPAKDITLFEIVELFEGRAAPRRATGGRTAGGDASARVGGVFAELQEQALFTLQSIRLATLAAK